MKMLVDKSQSHAPKESLALVTALADFVCFRSTSRDLPILRAELVALTAHIWPGQQIFEGGTHFRIILDGQAPSGESVYVGWRVK